MSCKPSATMIGPHNADYVVTHKVDCLVNNVPKQINSQ